MIDPYRFDWSLCRSFLTIVRNGSISAASRELGLSHPIVQRHLMKGVTTAGH